MLDFICLQPILKITGWGATVYRGGRRVTAKVRIRAGAVEFEYEGETEFAVSDIKELFSYFETLFKVPSITAAGSEVEQDVSQADVDVSARTRGHRSNSKLHVNSVASALDAKTGPDVAIAAAATLQILEGKEIFSRNDLIESMKKATKYYNKNMLSNLTKIISGLVGEEFNQISEGSYSLSASALRALEAKLA